MTIEVREQVPLSGYTTLRLGGPAARFIEARTDADVMAAVRAADGSGDPVLVLGGGSNVVVADEGFPGTVVRVATRGVEVTGGAGSVTITVAAGEDWDGLVARLVAEGLSGTECLSGIPGLCGATPIQNVGAYGQEVAETIVGVRVFDRQRDEVAELANADCGFGYRTSEFKCRAAGRYVILAVRFRLAADPLSRPIRYAELAAELGIEQAARVPVAQARAAVLRLRRRKGMVLDADDPDTRSVGSFFTNPVLGQAQFAALERAVCAACGPDARIPSYPAADGSVKVSAAWLIERAGFGRGHRGNGRGPGQAAARISTKHTLALVNPGGASTAALLDLAAEIRDGVHDRFGVELTSEPVLVGARL